VKRIRLTLPARILIAAAALCTLYFIASYRGIISEGDDPFFSQEMIENADKPLVLKIGITDPNQVTSIIAANGGLSTAPDSALGKRNLSCAITVFKDILDAENAFLEGTINVLATTPARFGTTYHSLEEKSPAVFLLSGSAISDCAVISRKPFPGSASIKGKSVICAERGESHVFGLFIAACAKVNADEIDWKFTNSDEETAQLYNKGKGDIAIIDYTKIKDPKSLPAPVVRSSEISGLFRSILVIREGLIAAHKDNLTAFINGVFEERTRISQMKNPDAASYLTGLGISNPLFSVINPAGLSAGYTENIKYFRLTPDREWDFCREFELVRALDDPDFAMADEVVNVIPFSSLPPAVAVKVTVNDKPRTSGAFILSENGLAFDETGSVTESSRNALKSTAFYATLSRYCRIVINTGNPSSPYVASSREQSVRTMLTKDYNVPAAIISAAKDNRESISLILTSPDSK